MGPHQTPGWSHPSVSSLTSGCRFIQYSWSYIVSGGDEGGRKWKRALLVWGIFPPWGTEKCQDQISMHFVWFLVNRHLRKAFSKCLVFCDILVRVLHHSRHSQKTRQSCEVTLLLHHLSLTPGVGVFLTHLCTVYTCLTSVGLFFLGRAFR